MWTRLSGTAWLDSAGRYHCEPRFRVNALPRTDKITLGTGTFLITRAGKDENLSATGDLDVTDDLIIEGAGTGVTIIDGKSLDRVLHIRPGGTLTLRNVTITGGVSNGNNVTQFGGGILNNGTLNLIDSEVIGNTASTGGGLASVGTTAKSAITNLINTVISANSATARGGAIHVSTSVMHIENGTIRSNSASGASGGILIQGSSEVTISNSLFEDNSANGHGGAMH